MICAWKEFLGILPQRLRGAMDGSPKEKLQELRLRREAPPELVLPEGSRWLDFRCSQEDLNFVVNTASRYSPWAASTVSRGFLTAPGGHRIGLCGETVYDGTAMTGMRNISSLCIRVARDYPGISRPLAGKDGSLLIIGPPGWGKTTLLRDLIREKADLSPVCVVDERGELFPEGLRRGQRTDVLTGCPKPLGIPMVLRTMGPEYIAVDEITQPEDCAALITAANCGVQLLATAHAASLSDLRSREIYRPLIREKVFRWLVILRRDNTYHLERMELCNTNGSEQSW